MDQETFSSSNDHSFKITEDVRLRSVKYFFTSSEWVLLFSQVDIVNGLKMPSLIILSHLPPLTIII